MDPLEHELPLSPAPSPVPSIRRLRIRSDSLPSDGLGASEQDVIARFHRLDPKAQRHVLGKLLESAPRETLLNAQSVISPRLRHDPFKVFPLEISLRILAYIRDPKSLAAAAQVSRLWYVLLSDDFTWKRMCQDHHYRRLSAAGSYVHQWRAFRDRASSQAIEETPEAEEPDLGERPAATRVSARRNSLLNTDMGDLRARIDRIHERAHEGPTSGPTNGPAPSHRRDKPRQTRLRLTKRAQKLVRRVPTRRYLPEYPRPGRGPRR